LTKEAWEGMIAGKVVEDVFEVKESIGSKKEREKKKKKLDLGLEQL
jgi:hypothetical protein